MYEPTRGGTRGGQAEFKWTDVSADKDREHYLGHSINAPTGRWQKNKDVHWYNRDKNDSEDAKAQELAKIKEAEREAMSIALGFKPSKPVGDGTTSGANAIPVANESKARSGPLPQPSTPDGDEQSQPGGSEEDKKLSKEERRAKRAEKKLAKEERKREKQEQRERRAMEVVARQRQRSASPRRRGDKPLRRDDGWGAKRDKQSLTPLDDLPWMTKNRDLSPPLPREEAEQGGAEHSSRRTAGNTSRRDYDGRAMERERENDRRRWEDNRARQERARGDWDRP